MCIWTAVILLVDWSCRNLRQHKHSTSNGTLVCILAGSSAGSSSAREEMGKPWEPPTKGELPAEWLAHFTPEELAI